MLGLVFSYSDTNTSKGLIRSTTLFALQLERCILIEGR